MKHRWEPHPVHDCAYCVRCNLIYKEEREDDDCDPRDLPGGNMNTPPDFGYGKPMTPEQVEKLLYLELVADTYHAIDAIKNPTIKKPRDEWIKELETLLKKLGHARPNLTSPRIMRERKAK